MKTKCSETMTLLVAKEDRDKNLYTNSNLDSLSLEIERLNMMFIDQFDDHYKTVILSRPKSDQFECDYWNRTELNSIERVQQLKDYDN